MDQIRRKVHHGSLREFLQCGLHRLPYAFALALPPQRQPHGAACDVLGNIPHPAFLRERQALACALDAFVVIPCPDQGGAIHLVSECDMDGIFTPQGDLPFPLVIRSGQCRPALHQRVDGQVCHPLRRAAVIAHRLADGGGFFDQIFDLLPFPVPAGNRARARWPRPHTCWGRSSSRPI